MKTLRKEIILIVEDEIVNFGLILELLDRYGPGHTLIWSPTGNGAITLIKKMPLITLLITDIQLEMSQGVSGYEVLDAAQARTPVLRSIAISGFEGIENCNHLALARGAELMINRMMLKEELEKLKLIRTPQKK